MKLQRLKKKKKESYPLAPLTELVTGYEEGSFQGLMETELLLWSASSWREENQVRKHCRMSMYGNNQCLKYQPKGFKLCEKRKAYNWWKRDYTAENMR